MHPYISHAATSHRVDTAAGKWQMPLFFPEYFQRSLLSSVAVRIGQVPGKGKNLVEMQTSPAWHLGSHSERKCSTHSYSACVLPQRSDHQFCTSLKRYIIRNDITPPGKDCYAPHEMQFWSKIIFGPLSTNYMEKYKQENSNSWWYYQWQDPIPQKTFVASDLRYKNYLTRQG